MPPGAVPVADRLTVQAGAVTSGVTILAPLAVRALVSGLLAVVGAAAVFIAGYPPHRPLQSILASVVAVVAFVALTRAARAAYVLTPDTLILRDVLATRTIPRSDIAGFPTAAIVERRDSWGSTQREVFLLFREDRALGSDERTLALARLRHWLGPEPEATAR